jgi:hypothetical protein
MTTTDAGGQNGATYTVNRQITVLTAESVTVPAGT